MQVFDKRLQKKIAKKCLKLHYIGYSAQNGQKWPKVVKVAKRAVYLYVQLLANGVPCLGQR